GKAAVRVAPARPGEWLLLFETLQPQSLITAPIRSAGLLGASPDLVRSYAAPEGWLLIDAVAHPSGDVSVLSLRADPAAEYPLRVLLSRFGSDGAVTHGELFRLPPPTGVEAAPRFMSSLDRARIVARGEDVFAVVRWANNSVQACRLGFEGGAWQQRWASWVEPAAPLLFIGIIGGGFDNFHQGDNASFVYADVDAQENLYVGVASTADLLPAHDAFFGEDLMSKADPDNFDFGTAIVTRIDAGGIRSAARLAGTPGRRKSLLNLRVAGDSVVLVGRIKTGDQPGSWDAWIFSTKGATGEIDYERSLDIESGDMFWDVAALDGGKLLAVGSTNYTQNPAGLSVSDARDALAVILDAQGSVEQRIVLPAGPPGRGNEAMSVSAGDRIAISGVQNAPGTHAEVFSDAFVVVRDQVAAPLGEAGRRP
ncbi:MAG TPA: hypothetical protein VFA79_01280, partial [Myxococcales bacterium]|nr:hypothetical protein [Myxococcales bacterium]